MVSLNSAPEGACPQGNRNRKKLGVEIKTNMVIGKVFTLQELFGTGLCSHIYRERSGTAKLHGHPGREP